jgi:hypothetical protein
MKNRILTPQDKKALSLVRDRRNSYGERGAKSRFAIARHKAKDLRKIRRRENGPLQQLGSVSSEEELSEAQLQAIAHPPRSWKKSPDLNLKWNVEKKLRSRAAIAVAGGRRKARG